MALVNAYCTVGEFRAQLKDDSEKLTASLIEKAINAASRSIDKFCGRRFWRDATTSVRVYRPDDTEIAWVDDISTTTGLVIKTDTSGDGTWATTWDAADYQLEPLNSDVVATGDTVTPYAWWRIVAIDDKTFPIDTLRTTLQVTARFGWSAVPDDVNEACIIKATSIYKRRYSPEGVSGFGEFGAVRISRRQDPTVYDLLHPFMRQTVGRV